MSLTDVKRWRAGDPPRLLSSQWWNLANRKLDDVRLVGTALIVRICRSSFGLQSQVELLRAVLDCLCEKAGLDRQDVYLWVHGVVLVALYRATVKLASSMDHCIVLQVISNSQLRVNATC
eukprot:6464386-Amphidinium_carterae.1